MTEMDRLIKLHAERLQRVYDERTAGDNTFIGAFVNFLIDIERARLDETITRIKNTEKERGTRRSHPCRCGNYAGDTAADLEEHVMAMMHVDDGKSHG